MKKTLTLAAALCAMTLSALYCANPDFNNPLDSRNLRDTPNGGEEDPDPLDSNTTYGTLNDPRDGKTYRTIMTDGVEWMAENLNYETAGNSWCYNDNNANCAIYGRLYSWDAAMTACPPNWALPDSGEWNGLIRAAGGSATAGETLKAGSPEWDGSDELEFSALPGGLRFTGGFSEFAETAGYWWTSAAVDGDANRAYMQNMETGSASVTEGAVVKGLGLSVRCVRVDVD